MPHRSMLLLITMLSLAPAAWAQEGDAAAGKKNFRQCAACHELATDKNKVGPSLRGIVGRQAGSESFDYSPALQAAADKGLVWTEENLMAYLENPGEFLKAYLGEDLRNKMFNRYRQEDFRRDVIAYLKEAAP